MTQGLPLRCVTFVLTLVAMQNYTRIDSDSILAFLCVAFLRLVEKKNRENLNVVMFHKLNAINTTQGPCVIL